MKTNIGFSKVIAPVMMSAHWRLIRSLQDWEYGVIKKITHVSYAMKTARLALVQKNINALIVKLACFFNHMQDDLPLILKLNILGKQLRIIA